MDVILGPVLRLSVMVVDLYMWIVIISVVLSWLVAFSIVNLSNRFVYIVGDLTNRLTEPALGRIRRFLPNLGNIDISPVVLLLALFFLKDFLIQLSFQLG